MYQQLFVCWNGILNLENKDFISNSKTNIDYKVFEKDDPKYVKLMEILQQIYPDNLNKVLKMWAKCLRGGEKEYNRKIYVHLGAGYNGKTTMMRLVEKTFGDYCKRLTIPLSKEYYDYRDKVRLYFLDECLFENNSITSIYKFVKEYSFSGLFHDKPCFDFSKQTFHIAANNITLPTQEESDYAYKNNYEIIEYNATFTEENQDKNLDIEQYAEVFLFILFEILKEIPN